MNRVAIALLALIAPSSALCGAYFSSQVEKHRRLFADPAGDDPVDFALSSAKSMDQFLEKLPKEFRSHFTLVYRSKSIAREDVSPRFPRVILFGRDARDIVAFTGDPDRPAYQTLERIRFDDRSGSYEFSEATFDPSGRERPTIRRNPESCVRCHGTPSAPIWESYPFWPGVYGSIDDRIQAGSEEDKAFQEFLARSAGTGRYRFLETPMERNVGDTGEYSPIALKKDYVRPNEHLSKALYYQNQYVRFPVFLKETLASEKTKWATFAAALGCGDLPADAALRLTVLEDYVRGGHHPLTELGSSNFDLEKHPRREVQAFLKGTVEAYEKFWTSHSDIPRSVIPEPLLRLASIPGVGIEMLKKWPLAPSKSVHGLEGPGTRFFYGEGSRLDFATKGSSNYEAMEKAAIDLLRDEGLDVGVRPCDELLSRHRKANPELGREPPVDPPSSRPPEAPPAPLDPGELRFKNDCLSCHAQLGGPRLAYLSSPEKLKAALLLDKTLIQRIIDRTLGALPDRERMPLGGEPLSDEDRSQLRSFLDQIRAGLQG